MNETLCTKHSLQTNNIFKTVITRFKIKILTEIPRGSQDNILTIKFENYRSINSYIVI